MPLPTEPWVNPEGNQILAQDLAPYRQGIAEFVGWMGAHAHKLNGVACQELMQAAVAYWGIPPEAFYDEPHDAQVLAVRAQLYKMTGEVTVG